MLHISSQFPSESSTFPPLATLTRCCRALQGLLWPSFNIQAMSLPGTVPLCTHGGELLHPQGPCLFVYFPLSQGRAAGWKETALLEVVGHSSRERGLHRLLLALHNITFQTRK